MAEYHLHAKTHSRGAGKGAGGHVRYILREGTYAHKLVESGEGITATRHRISRAEEVVYAGSGHLPVWAALPMDYWDAADLHERANGTVYREIEFALPRELPEGMNVHLAREFARRLSAVPGGVTPYTFAIHRSERDPALLHCHLMLSDKVHDGMARDPFLWFRRAANHGKDPAQGGAPKTQARISRSWLGDVVRPLWADLANDALEQAGVPVRIDHRSLETRRREQEILAEQLLAAGDRVGHSAALERVVALDRPPQPKRGRVLTHGGPAPDREKRMREHAQAVSARKAASMAAAVAHFESLILGDELAAAQKRREKARERLPRMAAARAKRLRREAVLDRALLRQRGRNRLDIQERWAWRRQQRETGREVDPVLENREVLKQEKHALADQDAAKTAPNARDTGLSSG